MITSEGKEWLPSEELVNKWVEAYPAINVEQELKAMEAWLLSNPKKRKTERGMSRFCNAWLKKANDKGGSPLSRSAPTMHNVPGFSEVVEVFKTRDMTSEDDLTHNFTNNPTIRANYLQKYGQVFEGGKRYKK